MPPWVHVPQAESGCRAHTRSAFGRGGHTGEGSSPPDSGGPTWRPGPGRKPGGPGVPGQGGLGVRYPTWNLVAFSEHLCPRGLRGHSGQGRRPFFGPKVSLDAGVTCVSALPEGPGTSLISRRPLQSSSSQRHCAGGQQKQRLHLRDSVGTPTMDPSCQNGHGR